MTGRRGPARALGLGTHSPRQRLLGIRPGLHLSGEGISEAIIQGREPLCQGPCGVTPEALFNLGLQGKGS